MLGMVGPETKPVSCRRCGMQIDFTREGAVVVAQGDRGEFACMSCTVEVLTSFKSRVVHLYGVPELTVRKP